MNRKTYSQILDNVARDQVPTSLDLAPQIMARIQKGKGATMQPRMKVFVMLILVLLVMATLLVNVPAVAAAIQRWFGYVPGFGLVHEGQMRVLAEPVSLTQNGFTLRVEKAILSGEKTMVTYALDGITADMLVKDTLESIGCRGVEFYPAMRLPDGRQLELNGFGGSDLYNDEEVTFGSTPADVNEATLIINCISRTRPEQVPQHWEVPLRFVPAPPDMTVIPVLDAPATLEPTALATVESSLTATTQLVLFKDGLVLKNVVPTQDGYILSGTITLVPPAGYVVDEQDGYLEDVTITDASGQVLQFGIAPDDLQTTLQSGLPENTYGWTCQLYGENIQWPLTMTVHSLAGHGPKYPQTEFLFDTGPDPKAEQVWKLDKDVALGPKTVHIVSIKRVEGDFRHGYEFTVTEDPSLSFWVDIQGYTSMGGGGGSGPGDGTITGARFYQGQIPTGKLTILVDGYELVKLPGAWQVTWQAPTGTTPTP